LQNDPVASPRSLEFKRHGSQVLMIRLELVMSHPPVFAVVVSAVFAIAVVASVYQSAHRPDHTIRHAYVAQSSAN
jgi:hypothetical protein